MTAQGIDVIRSKVTGKAHQRPLKLSSVALHAGSPTAATWPTA